MMGTARQYHTLVALVEEELPVEVMTLEPIAEEPVHAVEHVLGLQDPGLATKASEDAHASPPAPGERRNGDAGANA